MSEVIQISPASRRAATAVKSACINHPVRKTCPALSVEEIAEIIERVAGIAELREAAGELLSFCERAHHDNTVMTRLRAAIAKSHD